MIFPLRSLLARGFASRVVVSPMGQEHQFIFGARGRSRDVVKSASVE